MGCQMKWKHLENVYKKKPFYTIKLSRTTWDLPQIWKKSVVVQFLNLEKKAQKHLAIDKSVSKAV